MKSVILPNYNKNLIRAMLGLKVQETEMPVPGDSEVLIKVHASPVNPSDIAFIQGTYNVVKSLPAIPGFEASGVVFDAGENNKELIGKNVSCFVQSDNSGTWSEYLLANINDIIVLKDGMDMDQAACFTVNPITAYGLFDIALQYDAKSIIQNAAGGQVGNFIRQFAIENSIEVIDIVRKPETAKLLKQSGAKHVLVDTDEDFTDKLNALAAELKPTVGYDAVGGESGALIFNALDNNSELVVYGGLSGKQITGINVMDLIFNNKIISGFNLVDWKNEIEKEEYDSITDQLQSRSISGELQTTITGEVGIDDIVKGLRSYIADMSKGKLLIKP